MALSHEHVGSKILVDIKIYILARAELLCPLCYEIPVLSAVFVYFSSLCVSGRRESLNKNVLHKKMFSRSLPLASSSENLIGYRSSLGAYNQLCCFSFLL
jgi:hypothetical protein